MKSEVIDGTRDSEVFREFLIEVIKQAWSIDLWKAKNIVILLDNARVHTHQSILSLEEEYGITLLFNAEYSPHLNPVEQLFGLLKRSIKL